MFLLNDLIPKDFFTAGSLATLAGCTGIVFVICSGIQGAFDYNPKWLALLISLGVSLIAAYLAEDVEEAKLGSKYIIALLNGFLIYASATGTNQVIGSNPKSAGDNKGGGTAGNRTSLNKESKRELFTRWFS